MRFAPVHSSAPFPPRPLSPVRFALHFVAASVGGRGLRSPLKAGDCFPEPLLSRAADLIGDTPRRPGAGTGSNLGDSPAATVTDESGAVAATPAGTGEGKERSVIRTGAVCAGEDDADGIGQELWGDDAARLSRECSGPGRQRERDEQEQRLDAGGAAGASFSSFLGRG